MLAQEVVDHVTVPAGTASGPVTDGVRVWLRLEGAAVLVAAVALHAMLGASWLLFAALFLVPDVSFAGYAAGPRVGALAYNAVHSYVGPVLLAAALAIAGLNTAAALIWLAHIGLDRALGYGLKYASAFSDTHLGRIGRTRENA
jgi:hypothetical protein